MSAISVDAVHHRFGRNLNICLTRFCNLGGRHGTGDSFRSTHHGILGGHLEAHKATNAHGAWPLRIGRDGNGSHKTAARLHIFTVCARLAACLLKALLEDGALTAIVKAEVGVHAVAPNAIGEIKVARRAVAATYQILRV